MGLFMFTDNIRCWGGLITRYVCLAFCFAHSTVVASSEIVEGIEWSYTIRNGGAELGVSGGRAIPLQVASGSLKIPERLGGCNVTSIGNAAFYACSGLKSISIPNTVTSIGRSAFKGCGLTSLTIPRSVSSIGGSAFAGCLSLSTIDILSSNLWTEDSVFWNCTSLKSISIPSGLSTIARQMFDGCTSLESVTIASGVSAIEKMAFSCCSALKTVAIPASVSSIGDGVFYGCSSLSSIAVDTGSFRYQAVDGVLYDKSITKIVAFPVAKKGTYEIPSTITTIADYAFSDCSMLTSVVIPASVGTIGSSAFLRCKSLTDVTIPSSVTQIGNCAFSECSSLTHVSVPENVKGIGYNTFSGCNSLMSISLPSGLTDIGENAFAYCKSLASIKIPQGVTTIGVSAFIGCSSLISVELPSAVSDIPAALFADCSSLCSMTIPSNTTCIGVSAFARCSSLEFVRIPPSVTSIANYAFVGCEKLQGVVIPCAELDQSAFAECCSLEFAELQFGVDYIPANLFYGCSSLTTVTIPSTVESIDDGAFENCGALAVVLVDKGDVDRIRNMMSASKSGLNINNISIVEKVCDICFDANGGSGGCVTSLTYGTSIEFPIVSRMGYSLTGWCAAKNGGQIVMGGSTAVSNATYYAQWTADAPIPNIGNDPTAEQIADALGGSYDAKLIAYITDGKTYNAYREWADNVTGADGKTVGAKMVKESPNAWLSFALHTDKLIDVAPKDGDLNVNNFLPTSNTGTYEMTVELVGIEVGAAAMAENLKRVFGIEGSTSLDADSFSPDDVGIEFGTPVGGKVKCTVAPKDKTTEAFFIKVKMKP